MIHKTSERDERAQEMARPLTPKSDLRPDGWINHVSLQTTRGLCTKERKCFKKDGHEGAHYPAPS